MIIPGTDHYIFWYFWAPVSSNVLSMPGCSTVLSNHLLADLFVVDFIRIKVAKNTFFYSYSGNIFEYGKGWGRYLYWINTSHQKSTPVVKSRCNINQDIWISSLIARIIGPTWGPSGADRTQVGPILAPWTLLSGMLSFRRFTETAVI